MGTAEVERRIEGGAAMEVERTEVREDFKQCFVTSHFSHFKIPFLASLRVTFKYISVARDGRARCGNAQAQPAFSLATVHT